MRRLLSISFMLLALAIGATGAASTAHAQFDQTTASSDTDLAATANAANAAPNIQTDYKIDSAYNEVMILIMNLFAWLVGVAALTLDYAVYYTVVAMGNYVHNLSHCKYFAHQCRTVEVSHL